MAAYDGLDDVKTQTPAVFLISGLVQLVEPVKNKGQFIGGDGVAIVADGNEYLGIALPDLPTFTYACEDYITQVIYNLLDNAVKFCPEGGTLGLKISKSNTKIFVSVSNDISPPSSGTAPSVPPPSGRPITQEEAERQASDRIQAAVMRKQNEMRQRYGIQQESHP